MADRQVTQARRDEAGNIAALCKPGEEWSPRERHDVITDIESDTHRYFVDWAEGSRSYIRVVNCPTGKYLRTDREKTTRNNLDDLPDC